MLNNSASFDKELSPARMTAKMWHTLSVKVSLEGQKAAECYATRIIEFRFGFILMCFNNVAIYTCGSMAVPHLIHLLSLTQIFD